MTGEPQRTIGRPGVSVPCDSTSRFYEARRRALEEQLEARKLPVLVVTKPANIFYLTGFRGTAGVAIFGSKQSLLFVDPRYTIQARDQSAAVEVIEVRNGLYHAAGTHLRKLRVRRTGFEDTHLSVEEFTRIRKEGPSGAEWQPAAGLVEELRVIKDDYEIAQIRSACQLTAAAFEEMLPLVRPGAVERDLACELDFRMRRKGAEEIAFQTIVASGPRGALPHARPSAKALMAGELVIFDLGAILGGYAADMTRTVYLGKPRKRERFLYQAVLDAQEEAIASLRANVRAGDADAAARIRLAKHKLGNFFTHSTGHGVGIEIHERPRLGKGEKTRIPAGSVVTIEPGIYMQGVGGIRIEDTVLVRAGLPEILTSAPKDRWWVD